MSIEATMSNPSQASTLAALPHVLVVDDDPTIRELVTDYLGRNELRVTAVADGGAMQAILADLIDGGYLKKSKVGRRNSYTVNPKGRLRHPLEAAHTVGELIDTLT